MSAPTGLAVVDASLVAMWALSETYSSPALALAAEWARTSVQPIAPCFMLAEVTNAIYKRVTRGQLTLAQARDALDVVLAFGVRLDEEPDLHRQAMGLADRLSRPTTYDGHYLGLAEMHGCELWTGDERFYNAVRIQFARLRWIGTYQPAVSGP